MRSSRGSPGLGVSGKSPAAPRPRRARAAGAAPGARRSTIERAWANVDGIRREGARSDGGRVVADDVRERQHPRGHPGAGPQPPALEGGQVFADSIELMDARARAGHGRGGRTLLLERQLCQGQHRQRRSAPGQQHEQAVRRPTGRHERLRRLARLLATFPRHGVIGSQQAKAGGKAPDRGRRSGGAMMSPWSMAGEGPSARSRPSAMGPATLPRASRWVGAGRPGALTTCSTSRAPSMWAATSRKSWRSRSTVLTGVFARSARAAARAGAARGGS